MSKKGSKWTEKGREPNQPWFKNLLSQCSIYRVFSKNPQSREKSTTSKPNMILIVISNFEEESIAFSSLSFWPRSLPQFNAPTNENSPTIHVTTDVPFSYEPSEESKNVSACWWFHPEKVVKHPQKPVVRHVPIKDFLRLPKNPIKKHPARLEKNEE